MSQAVDVVCSTCKSANVARDAWAIWDRLTQRWVLGAVFDYGHCHDCDSEARLEVVQLAIDQPR